MTSTDTLAATEGGVIGATSSSPIPFQSGSEVRFEDLGLGPQVLKAVADSGYTTPTPIQAQGIPPVLKGRDIIGIAQTGTGKTASFTLPMIEILARGRAKARMPRTLILEPTRELAAQVAESFERYGKYHKLNMALLIGGVSFEDQDKKLDRGVDVLIATPGRLLDHFERGKLMLSQVQILVIDEADRMLDMGFIPDVERIAKLIPFTRQTLFYSATMPPEIQRLTDQFLQGPVRIEVSRPATAATTIVQMAVTVPGGDWSKRESLRRLIRDHDVKNAIVFCNRKRDVDVVAKSLQKHGFSAAPLHGDLDQSVRTRTLDAFRAGEIRLLVASVDGLPEEHEKPHSNNRRDGQRHRDGRGRGSNNNRDARHRGPQKTSHHASTPPSIEEKDARTPVPLAPQPAPHRQQAQKPQRPTPTRSSESNGHDPSQLPAFLLRPVQLPPRPVKKTSATDLLPESSVSES